MSRGLRLFGWIFLIMWLCPAGVWAKQATYLDLNLGPPRVAQGSSISIACQLWTTDALGIRQRIKGGLLTLSVYDLDNKRLLRTYVSQPDGLTDIFRVNWIPNEQGTFKVEVYFSGTAALAPARNAAVIEVGPPTPPKPPPSTTTTSSTTTTLPRMTTTTTTLPPTTTTTSLRVTTTTMPPTTTTTLPRGPDLKTKILLSLKPSSKPDQIIVTVQVTTTRGQPVEEGEVLVTVTQGKLSPGHQGQALLSAAAGHQEIVWIGPPKPTTATRLDATYFGGPGPEGDYQPSSASLRWPIKR